MKGSSTRFGLCLLIVSASPVLGDVVHLKSGGRIEGRIIESSENSVAIEVAGGTIRLPLGTIEGVERSRSSLDEYDEKVAALAEDDLDGWRSLARWAGAERLSTHSLDAYQRVLDLDPDDAEANQAMGRVRYEGSWVSQEEAHRARGYVRFEGRWIPPDEREAILAERQRRAELLQAQLQAEAVARQADARAREAEARAREAEARERDYGIPVYWMPWWAPRPGPGTGPPHPGPLPAPIPRASDPGGDSPG